MVQQPASMARLPIKGRAREQARRLYDRDLYRWTRQQAKLLRAGKLSELDLANLAEEIESLGKRDLREMFSRLRVLIAHLLKCQVLPGARVDEWKSPILAERGEIEYILEDSPSLRTELVTRFPKLYADAAELVRIQTGLPPGTFPASPPFTLDQALDHDFMLQD
jgi:hypothetical protein